MKQIKNIFLLGVFLLLCAPSSLWTLNPGKKLSRFILDTWWDEQGLPQNTITSIIQTGDGYIWLGTQDGLRRLSEGSLFVKSSAKTFYKVKL